MSARKGFYAITDVGCDGGVSPNAYVPRITAEIRLHFPPATVTKDQVREALITSMVKIELQIDEYFDGWDE